MRNLTNRWSQSRHFFPESGNFFPIIEKEHGRSLLLPLEVISYLFRRALIIQSNTNKRMCKTAFSTKFRTMELKVDTGSIFLIFISINQQLFHLAPCTQTCVESVKHLTNQAKIRKLETTIDTFSVSVSLDGSTF